MRVCFWHSDKPRERVLSDAFLEGVRSCGDEVKARPLQPHVEVDEWADVACMVGVKSRELFHAHWRAGVHTVYLDKGYTRHSVSGGIRAWEYWRVAVDGHHPTHQLEKMTAPRDRLDRLDLHLTSWRNRGEHIVFAGSSAKYHDFYSLPDPTAYAAKYIKRIRSYSKRRIVYRPKPSWKEAVPIEGADYSEGGSISEALQDAHALVTHGSNAVFEAILMGIPCIVLGDAVAKSISSTDVAQIERPWLATMGEREQWLANLAYMQWTQAEMASGEAWRHIRPQIYG